MTVLDEIIIGLSKALVAIVGSWKVMKQAWIFGAAALGVLLLGYFFRPQEIEPNFLFNTSKLDTRKLDSEVEVPPDAKGLNIDVVVSHGRTLQFDEPVESVFLADPSIADLKVVSPDKVYIFGKKIGTTNLIAISGDGNTAGSPKTSAPAGDGKLAAPAADKLDIPEQLPALQATIRLRVVADIEPPNDARRALEPQSVVPIDAFGKRMVAKGRAKNIEEAVSAKVIADTYSEPGQPPILHKLEIEGSQQVNLRVRFAEVSRSDLQTLGINWQMFNTGNFSFVPLSGNSSRHVDANALVDALQRNGVINVLAEPNLTTVTGQTASFLAGGEFPVPVPQAGGTTTSEFKTFGVSLVFTPTLIKKNRMALHVHPEVSMLSMTTGIKIGGVEVPVILVRRTDTTIELASGQTFAIGGLFQRQLSQSADDMDKLMILGDLPVIGALFRSPRFRRNETELVILVTAYLVEPVSDARAPVTPLDRPEPPEPVQTRSPVSQPGGMILK